MSKKLRLGAFLPGAGQHVAAWRHPDANANGPLNFEHYKRLAQTAERGLFDAFFLADGLAANFGGVTGAGGSAKVTDFEPVTLFAALSQVTTHIGFIATASTTYEEPYSLARKYASLDYLSGGRAGWNVVTTIGDETARNFGREQQLTAVDRYDRAEEFVDTVKELWDSWEDDAFIRDKATGQYFDPAKVHPPQHKGKHFSVAGALNVARPPQGYPVPKIIKWTGMTADQQEAMKQRAREANAASSYFYKAGWTTGYWPTKKQPGDIDLSASLVGKYSLTTSYTGNVEIEAPSNVNFLDPIMMSSPNLENKIDLKKSIPFAWQKIPNALGQNATITAMEGKNTLIIWSSSEVFVDSLLGDMGFLQMAEVKDFVSKTMFMAGDRTSVTVPAGIFANADFAMMNMAGYGPGAALEKAQPLPRIQTKTSLMLMLGGKKMNFGG